MKSLARIIIALAVLLGFNSATSWGQEIVSLHHIVQRGETVESLADRYRLSTDMLKAVNLGMDMFHVGQEVLIPVDKKYMFLRSEDESEDILDDIASTKRQKHFAPTTTRKPTNSSSLPSATMQDICLAKKPTSDSPCVPTIVTNGNLLSMVLRRS